MIKLHWQFVFLATIVLYILMILALPFSSAYATIFLFTLIGFWSRLPGVGIYHPLWILYNMDLVDIFVVIMAVNGYVTEAILASLFMNLYSRACGVFPVWGPVIHDAFAMVVVSLVLPFIHVWLGGNIFFTMAAFTILRACIWPIFAPFTYNVGIVRYAIEWITSVVMLLFINGIYIQFFGSFFSDLLGGGVQFSWPLFIFATLVIFIGFFIMNSRTEESKRISLKSIFKRFIIKPKHKKHHPLPGRELRPMQQVYRPKDKV